MKNNEAINIILEHNDAYVYSKEDMDKYNKAIGMAIKSLEQESVLDKIKAKIETWHKDGTNWSDIRLMNIEDIINK